MDNLLLQEVNEGVLVIFFNRPQKKNAFDSKAWLQLTDALYSAKSNDAVHVLVLTGAGDDFSAGQDLSEFGGKDEQGLRAYQYVEKALLDFDKPLLMCAKGITVGGGGTMLLHADIVYVGESLRFRLPFAGLGIAPELGSSYLLPANIGTQRAAEILLCAEWLDADQVVAAGIAARKFSDDELLEKTLAKAASIAQLAPKTLVEIKRCLKLAQRSGVEAAFQVESAAMDKLVGGLENVEAVTAFMEKRPPNFKQPASK